jgi:hypothetical protein
MYQTYQNNIINAQNELKNLYNSSDYSSFSININTINNYLRSLKENIINEKNQKINQIDTEIYKLYNFNKNIDDIFGNPEQTYIEGTAGTTANKYYINNMFIEKIKTNVDNIIINKNTSNVTNPPKLYTFTFTKPNTKFNNIEAIKLI